MNKNNNLKPFEGQKIRSIWNPSTEEWYFSIVDVVGALTDSANPTDYLKKLRKRDQILGVYIGTNCPHVEMPDGNGKHRKLLSGTTQQILRLIQSIPSKKAEPFKLWLAQVGNEFIDETIDPELAINRAINNYRRLGYSENWINQRIKTIEVRKALTDEWDKSGVKRGKEYATLTDLMYKTWADMTTREYKNFKGLKKENLRDNMTNVELVLNMLAEVTATDISVEEQPVNLTESTKIAREGAEVAKGARKLYEKRTKKSALSPLSAKKYLKINNEGEDNE